MKNVKTKKLYGLLLLLPLMSLLLLTVSIQPVRANAEAFDTSRYIRFHGIPIRRGTTIETYYMRIPLTQIGDGDGFGTVWVNNDDSGRSRANAPLILSDLRASNHRTRVSLHLRIAFENVRNNHLFHNRTPFIDVITEVELGRTGSLNSTTRRRTYLLEDIVISLSNNYFIAFNSVSGNDLTSGITISILLGNGRLYRLQRNSAANHNLFSRANFAFDVPNITLHNARGNIEQADPDSDEWNADFGNTGTNTTPSDYDPTLVAREGGSLWDRLLDFIAGLFDISITELQMYLVIAGIIFAVAVIGIPILKGVLSD